MIRLRATVAIIAVISVTHAAHLAHGDDPKAPAKESSVWMKQKLGASQNILAGLTKGDYDAIEKNAQSMLAVGYLEKWIRADTPGYQILMKDFEYANKSLILAAREKNLDGATIGYVQLTLSCVHCHKIVRTEGK
jgi:cytochrome c556